MTYREAYNVLIKAWQGNKESEDYPDFDDICEALTVIGRSLNLLETLMLNLDSKKYLLSSENESLKNRVEDLEICYKVLLKENQELKQKVKTYEDLLHTIEEEVLE